MALDTKNPATNRTDRSVGNIYDKLEAARRKRERVLDTPPAANDDRRADTSPVSAVHVFPTLKPPRPESAQDEAERSWGWALPWLLGLAIFVVIFAFAVS